MSVVRAVAFSTALAMLASAGVAVQPRMASAAPVRAVDPRQVPVLPSQAAATRQAARANPGADFAPLMGNRTHFDQQRSRPVSRTMFGTEYENPDGTHTQQLGSEPLNVRDSDGQWRPVDSTVVMDEATGRLRAARHPLGASLAARGDDPALLRVEVEGRSAWLSPETTVQVGAIVNESTVRYPKVWPDTDLVYEVTPGAVKETIRLAQPPAKGRASWHFRLGTNGLTPKLTAEGAVVLADQTGRVLVAVPPVETWDSSGSADHPPAVTRGRYNLEKASEGWLLTVSVDEQWLRDPAREYPVSVDPTFSFAPVDSWAYKTDGYVCQYCGLRIGNSLDRGDSYWRTVFHPDYSSLFGRNVIGARLDVANQRNVTAVDRTYPAWLYHASAFDFNGVGEYLADGLVGQVGSFSGPTFTSYLRALVSAQDPRAYFMLIGSELAGTWTYKNMAATLYVDTGSAPPAPTLVGPADNAVLTGLTPTLSVNPVSDPDGDAVSYCFRVATGADANSGVVVDSGCLGGPSWTVPDGVLQDGVSYTWRVAVRSGVTDVSSQVWHLRVDQRIGEHGPAPVDSLGTVTVNLANGNVSTTATSPTFNTVGGTAGVSLTYNSQQDEPRGLRASYFVDLSRNGNIAAGQQPVLVRTEPQVNVDWGVASPFPPALDADYFVVRWEGYFRPPVTGAYQFAGLHDDGAKIWVNNALLYNVATPSGVNWSQATAVNLTAGQLVPIKVELAEQAVLGYMRLFVQTTDGTTVPPQIVPADWLSTVDSPALPRGWALSADLDGTGSSYTEAKVTDQTIVLTDATGAKHTWTKRSTGGYAPPEGEDGILALDAGGRVTLTDGSDVFVFRSDGKLETQSSALDSRHPAALENLYDGTPSRLREIRDPVSNRSHRLSYNRSGDDCYGGLAPPPGAAALPPTQMLCRIAYWDGTQTVLWYDTSGRLVRVEDPGSEVTDYSYNSSGWLDGVRDPLASDWVAVDPGTRNTRDTMTVVHYQNAAAPKPVADELYAPVPSPGRPRPRHTYRHDPANRRTFIDVGGLTPAIGYFAAVTYDADLRQLSMTDATGKTTSQTWNVQDKQLSSTDPAGRVSTTVYDHAGRVVDTYGPAPASCFTGQLPTTACAATVPNTHTGYDQGLAGLGVNYYDNASLTGAPKSYVTGVGTADGRLTLKTGGPFVGLGAKCLDVSNSGTADGTRIQLWTCNGTDAQRWSMVGATIRALGKCLDVSGAQTADGTRLILYSCYGGPAQQWVAQADGSVVNPMSGKCLDVDHSNTADGTQIQIWTCNGSGAQQWILPPNTGSPSPGVPGGGWSARFTGEVVLPEAGTYALGMDIVGGARLWLDDVLIADGWADHPTIGGASGPYNNTVAGSRHRVRIDYTNLNGNALLNFTWQRPGQAWSLVDGQYLNPRYGLTTTTLTAESAGVPDQVTTKRYHENGLDAAYGLLTSMTNGPLTHRTGYEPVGTGYLRPTDTTMPSGAQITNAYYGDTENRANPCVAGSPAVNQAGMVKLTTRPAPATGTARSDELVYDASGRVVAKGISGTWSCTAYDARDRVVTQIYPASATAAARTVTQTYAVGGDPLTTAVSDQFGTVTTTVDLLGRPVEYVDAQGIRTVTAYDQVGRVITETVTPPNSADAVQNTTYTYDDAGRVRTVRLDGALLATANYDAAGELADVSYANGSALTAIGRDNAGSTVSLAWRTSDGVPVVSTVGRTRAGTIVDETLAGVDARPNAPNYVYDSVGRLTEAWVDTHHYTYDFTSSAPAGCPAGTRSNAGLNTNRVRLLDQVGSATAETGYCYDNADRILASTGVNPVTAIMYDSHGNTSRWSAGGVTTALDWDGADRNTGAHNTGADTSDVTYGRDATDRIIRRDASGESTVLYGYTGGGDSADLVLGSDKRLLSRTIGLPGGVVYSVPAGGSATWDHPTVRGDLVLTTDSGGRQLGSLRTYNPSGEPLSGVPDNLPGSMDYGWLGQHQRPYEHSGSFSLVQMGARPYLPLLGRFLAVDPVEGGSANDYDYVNGDPVNSTDLDGRKPGGDCRSNHHRSSNCPPPTDNCGRPDGSRAGAKSCGVPKRIAQGRACGWVCRVIGEGVLFAIGGWRVKAARGLAWLAVKLGPRLWRALGWLTTFAWNGAKAWARPWRTRIALFITGRLLHSDSVDCRRHKQC